jgi:hypothetical protein
LRQGLLGFQRIVDDDDVRTPAGQHSADRVARRHIDDHPADPAGAHRFELGGGHLEMPV